MESFLSGRPVVRPPRTAAGPAADTAEQNAFKPYLVAATAPQEVQQAQVAAAVPAAKEELLNQPAPTLPAVEVQEVDGVVKRIIVKCSCCRTIELECVY